MKILCVGNRYIHPDGAALWLYDEAVTLNWAYPLQWVEGGLGGLNLSPHFDTQETILIVDYMPDYAHGQVLSLSQLLQVPPQGYDHHSALLYLLHSLPQLYKQLPPIFGLACKPENQQWQQQALDCIVDFYKSHEQAA